MGTAIAVVWGIVLFILGCIAVVALGGILATLIVYTVKSVQEGMRQAREARMDAAEPLPAPKAPVTRGNVTSIFNSGDEK